MLLDIAEAIFRGDTNLITTARNNAVAILGAQATADAIAVIAAFNGITKVANATGLPLDDSMQTATADMRQSTGIDNLSEANKARRYDL